MRRGRATVGGDDSRLWRLRAMAYRGSGESGRGEVDLRRSPSSRSGVSSGSSVGGGEYMRLLPSSPLSSRGPASGSYCGAPGPASSIRGASGLYSSEKVDEPEDVPSPRSST